MADIPILVAGSEAAPAGWEVPATQEVNPKAAHATVDGTSAAQSFIPVLEIITDGGKIISRCVGPTVAAGGSADVSWFPGADVDEEAQGQIPIAETLMLPSWANFVSSSNALPNGVTCLISVQGTYSDWNLALNNGSPEADAQFPSTPSGVTRISTQVGIDADTLFAYPTAHPQTPGHWTDFQIDTGSGFAHVEPVGGPYTTPQTGHVYTYHVVGQGSAVRFRINDSPLNDNYGALQIIISGVPVSPSGLAVTDGTHTVANVTSVDFTSGATVSAGATGVANVAVTGGGASPLTTKGDIFGHSTVDARIPVGADGTALFADSTQTLGVAYKNVSAVSGVMGRNVPPAGGIMETIPRWSATTGNAPPSGSVQGIPVYLDSGVTITSISFANGSTAIAAATNQVFGLYNAALALLATTTDDTSTAWAANTIKTLNLTPGTFTTTYAGIHWIALLLVATTRPNVLGSGVGTIPTALRTPPFSTAQSAGGNTALPNPVVWTSSQGLEYYAFIS